MIKIFFVVTALLTTFSSAFAEFDSCILYVPVDSEAVEPLLNFEVLSDHPDTKVLCMNNTDIKKYESLEDYNKNKVSLHLKTFYIDLYDSTYSGTKAINAIIVPLSDGSLESEPAIILNRVFMDLTGDMFWGDIRYQYSLSSYLKTK